MNKKIKNKWMKALRSGQYAQTKEKLCEITPTGDSFCCLGVLCDLYAREDRTRPGFETNDENASRDSIVTYMGSDTHLPCVVQDWAGIGHGTTALYHIDSLINLNDHGTDEEICDEHGEYVDTMYIEGNFNDIADYIEKEM